MLPAPPSQELVDVFQKLADHTKPKCAKCRPEPYSCCDAFYCEMTITFASETFGVTLVPTGHKTLPLMGQDGCTAAPHLRPQCAMHTCSISTLGFDPADADWTEEYYSIRDDANVALFKHMSEKSVDKETRTC